MEKPGRTSLEQKRTKQNMVKKIIKKQNIRPYFDGACVDFFSPQLIIGEDSFVKWRTNNFAAAEVRLAAR